MILEHKLSYDEYVLKEQFFGHNPSHFLKVNPIVRAYIISDSFLWSAWNFITPIFAVFATTEIDNGNVEVAAAAFSTYLISRVVFELISGRIAAKSTDKKKIFISTFGILIISLAYIGFSFSYSIPHIFIFYAVAGAGLGIASPAKNSLFSMHLDKNKEATEWSIADAATFISMALSATVGGFIAGEFGFRTLFIIAAFVNLLALPPYLLYIRETK